MIEQRENRNHTFAMCYESFATIIFGMIELKYSCCKLIDLNRRTIFLQRKLSKSFFCKVDS